MKKENEATVSDKTARQLEHKESPQQVSTSGAEVMPVDTEPSGSPGGEGYKGEL